MGSSYIDEFSIIVGREDQMDRWNLSLLQAREVSMVERMLAILVC